MKLQEYLVVLFATLTTVAIASRGGETASEAAMTTGDSFVIAAAPAVSSNSIEGAISSSEGPDFPQRSQSKQELARFAVATSPHRGVTLLSFDQASLRRRRIVENAEVETFERVDDKTKDLQEQRNLKKESVFKGKTGKFFDKTINDFRSGKEDRPLFRQFSMPLLGMGPFGLALGRPRGGRFHKGRGDDNAPDERRVSESYNGKPPQYE